MGLTISSLTVMGFILVLGIVVDDAIVVGEREYMYEQKGLSKSAALPIRGDRRSFNTGDIWCVDHDCRLSSLLVDDTPIFFFF